MKFNPFFFFLALFIGFGIVYSFKCDPDVILKEKGKCIGATCPEWL